MNFSDEGRQVKIMPTPLESQSKRLSFALYTSSQGNFFFHEIRDLIGAGLKELGITVEMRNERAGFSARSDWHLVIAPHEFFELGAGKDLATKAWPKNLILFNTEQPSSHWLTLSVKHFERAAAVWDIDFDSSLRIGKLGYRCDYLPLGQTADSPLFQPVATLPLIEETRSLTEAIRQHSGFNQPLGSRPIDLLFLGHGSARREKFFSRHAARIKPFNSFLHKPAATRPLIPGQTTNMNTLTSVGLSQRSKILLNLHHGVDRYFEWHRIVLLGIAQRTLVITEPCSIAPPFQANVDYVEAPTDELPDCIEYYLKSSAGRAEAQKITDQGFATLNTRCRLSDYLRPLVEQLNHPTKPRLSNTARFFPVVDSATKTASSLSLCVVTPDVAGEGLHADCGSAQVALAEMLAQAGHQVTLLHTEGHYGESRSASYWRKYFSGRGIDYQLLPTHLSVPVEATEACTRSYETYLWLRENPFAVVHLPETHGIGFYSLLAKKQGLAFSQTRFCLNAYSPRAWRRVASQQFINNPYELELDFLEQECFSRADALTTSTRFLREWLEQQNWHLPVERRWRPDFIVPPATAVPVNPEQIHELVYLGSLGECPGLTLFCDALDQFNAASLREVKIIFADDSTTPKNSKALAYFYDRTRQWTFDWKLAATSKEQAACLNGEGRLIVLVTLEENSPVNLRRCLARKLPFLAVQCSGVAELIQPNDQSKVLCAGTPAALTAALQKILRDGIRPAKAVETASAIAKWQQWHDEWAGQTSPAVSPARVSPPLVSVCLVHFNRPEFLAQALASLRAQDYPNFEIVLVDDGSTKAEALDFLASLEPEFKQRNWRIIRQKNSYLGAARNHAARHARGEFLVFMDDDNFAKPHQLSTFVRIAQHTGAEIVTSAMDLFTGNAAPLAGSKPKARWIFLGGAAATGAFRNCFGDANGCIRRETFLRLGGFTEDRGITHEDWEFYAHAVLQGCHLETTPEALFHYRVAERSMIRSTPRYANHQRSLRPYIAAVPSSLQGLIRCLQGVILFPAEKNIPNPGHENLLRLHRRLMSIAKELIVDGKKAAAETIFLELLQSAYSTQHPGIALQAMLEIARILVENNSSALAENLLEQAVKISRGSNDSAAIKEAADLLLAARNQRLVEKKLADNKSSSPLPTASPSASITEKSVGKLAAAEAALDVALAQTPLVSIIIPVFNKLALTQACLVALARIHNAVSSEIIVVNNASTDGTADFLSSEQFAGHLRTIINRQNHGFAHACNQGAAIAYGSLLLFLNNDTQVTAGWLDALIHTVRLPDVGIVGAKLLYANNTIQHAGIEFINGVPDHPYRHAPANAPQVNQLRELDMVTGACLMIHRDLFQKLGGFDEIFINGVEDVDLCLRVRSTGKKVAYEPKSVVYHLEGQSAGRFNHAQTNLEKFFQRWRSSFDRNYRFIVPSIPRFVRSQKTFFDSYSVSINWIGSFLDHGSLSHVNREMTAVLKSFADFQVECIGNGAAPAAGFEELAREISSTPPRDAALTVHHAWPPNWQRPQSGKLAVIQPWEFGALPEDWVRRSRDVDEFWVPSNYVRSCYVESGVPAQKVFVVPNGIDPQKFHPQVAPMKLATQKKFKFLFVGGTIGRKGPDLLLQAYLKNFTAADDVCLVIKDFGSKTVYQGQTFEKQIRAAQSRPNAPEILYLNEELPPEKLPSLYTACDCFVLPYRGEGFGLPVLEAMACSLPIIVTKGGATDDFVRDEFAWRIPAARKIFGREVSGMKLAGNGWLLEPDLDAFGKFMRQAFTNPVEACERGKLASLHAHQFCTWQNSAEIAAQRIRKLLPEQKISPPSISVKRATESPSVAHVGQLNKACEWFGQKKFQAAWEATLAATAQRPFHPEAFLLLAEIAVAVGDGSSARLCAQLARQLAPDWNAPKQFLKKPLKGNAKLDWLKLPDIVQSPKSKIQSLSVCLVVKNEEKFLAQCLQSVRDVAQQIVVVDTGSTDRTVEIAKTFGAEVFHFDWCDDFSAARNAALEHANGDWILMLDADEELSPAQHANLRTDMSNAGTLAYRLPLINRGLEAEGRNFVPRLFRNVPGIFYTGRIHEQIFPSLMPRSKSWGLKLSFGSAEILHHGYTKELVRDRSKVERNLNLLRLAVAENPNDANLMMNFGLELIRSENLSAGIEKYREAFRLMSAQKPEAVAPELREVFLTQFTSQLYKVRAHEEIVQVFNSPLAKRCELTASHHFALGLAFFELKQFDSTIQQMRACLAKRNRPALSPINTDILTAAPQHCLALSLMKTGDADGAEKAFHAALGENGRSENVKLDYAKFLANQNRAVEAFNQLHALVSADARHFAAWRSGGEIALSRPEFLEFARDWTGEAVRYVAEDFTVSAQRAEVLLLGGETAAAMELWERLWNSERQSTILSALILCEVLESRFKHQPNEAVNESATSHAFIKWYQKLIAMRAYAVVGRINEKLESLALVLPTAAKMLEQALAEPQRS